MGRRRVFREKIRKPDEFISTTARAIEYVKENPEKVAILAGALIAAFVVVVMTGRYLEHRAESVARMEWQARNIYDTAVEDAARVPEAIAALKEVYEEHPGKMAGQASLYLAASLSYRSGDFASAADGFRLLTEKHKKNEVLYPLALRNLAYALEQTGDLEGAAGIMEEVIGRAEGPTAYQAKLDLGRIYEELGEADKARSLWEEVLESDPEGDWAAPARRLLGLPPPADAGV